MPGPFVGSRLGFLAGGGGNSVIDPSTLPNLAAWFRKGVGVTEATGLVSQWADQSGNSRHLTQATDTNKPALQGDGSILFDGVDNSLVQSTFSYAQPETIYILAKQITWTANDRWFDSAVGGDRGIIQQFGTTPQIRIYAGAALGAVSLTLDTYGIVCAVFNGASSVLQLNLTAPVTGNAGTDNMGSLRLGCPATALANFGNIQVKEILMYSAAHDATTRAQVIRYLESVEQEDDPAFFI